MRIRSVRHKGLRRLMEFGDPSGIQPSVVDKVVKILAFLQDMADEDELRSVPTWKAHRLTGDSKGPVEPARHQELADHLCHRPPRGRDHRPRLRGLPLSEDAMTEAAGYRLKAPPHPGGFVRTEIIDPLELSVTEAAEALGVSRAALSAFLNGRADLSPDMALRIEKAFGVKMDTLMRMQNSFDIAAARRREAEIEVAPYRPLASTSTAG